MGGCATKMKKAVEAEDRGGNACVKPPEDNVQVEEEKKMVEIDQEFKERVKEIVGEDEEEVVVDELHGCKQRRSLSLLFKQEEVKDATENDKPANERKREPIIEDQELGAVKLKEDVNGLEDIQEHEEAETPDLSKETSYKVGATAHSAPEDAEDVIESTQKRMVNTSEHIQEGSEK